MKRVMPLEVRDWSNPFDWLETRILETKGKESAAYNRFCAKLNHLSLIWKRLEDETMTNESCINLIVKRAKEGASIEVDEIYRLFINSQFLSLDLEDFVIHSRILMDRVVVLVAYLIEGPARSLQHASFHEHRRFFLDPKNIPYNPDEEYARYIREQTGWFEIMLRDARDILIVHDSSLHGAGLLSGPQTAPRRLNTQLLNWGLKQQEAYEKLLQLRDKYAKTLGEPLSRESNIWELLDLFEKHAEMLTPDNLKTITEVKRRTGGKLPDVNILSARILEFVKFAGTHFKERYRNESL